MSHVFVYRWKGRHANPFEWQACAMVANEILNKEQNGRGAIYEIHEDDGPNTIPAEVLRHLGKPPSVFRESSISDPEPAPRLQEILEFSFLKISIIFYF